MVQGLKHYNSAKIYKLVDSADGMFYIGSTCSPLQKRLQGHKTKAKQRPHQKVYEYFNAIGWENVSIILIKDDLACENIEQLRREEQCFIESFRNDDCCLNSLNAFVSSEDRKEYCKLFNSHHWKDYCNTNKERLLEYHKQYYKSNRNKIREYQTENRETNRGKMLEREKQYRMDHKEDIKERDKLFREANKDKINECNKNYRRQNRDKIREYQNRYRQTNKEQLTEQNKQYYQNNCQKISEKQKQNRRANIDQILEMERIYRQNNRDKVNKKVACHVCNIMINHRHIKQHNQTIGHEEKQNKQIMRVSDQPCKEDNDNCHSQLILVDNAHDNDANNF